MSNANSKSDWGDYFRKFAGDSQKLVDAANDPDREYNLTEYGTANPDMVYSIKCHKACEGFDDPTELRRQRDEAIRLLRYLSRVKGVSDTVAWYNCTKGVRTLLETIDQGEPK